MIFVIMAFLLSSSTFAKVPLRLCFSNGISEIPSLRRVSGVVLTRSSTTSTIDEGGLPSAHSAAQTPSVTPQQLPYFPIYYNDVYEVDLPKGHRFPMDKYRKVRLALQDKILSPDTNQHVLCEFRQSPLASFQQLATTHNPEYISRYITGKMTERENRNIGFPWSEQHVNRSLSSVGGTVHAALSAWEEFVKRKGEIQQQNIHSNDAESIKEQINEPLCWGAHVAGGTHHAFSDYGEGFCIFSDIAVAANVLLEAYGEQSEHSKLNPASMIRRILIIDLDVHQGNGNAALFQGNERVKTFSMHCVANYFSEKQTSDLDVELPVGCNDETYLSTLRYWLRRIENHNFDQDEGNDNKKQFDVIFYQAGVDIHHADRLGKLSITQEGISRRNSMVFDFAKKMGSPLVISMGGGYPKGDDRTPILEAHTSVYWEAHQYLSAASGSGK